MHLRTLLLLCSTLVAAAVARAEAVFIAHPDGAPAAVSKDDLAAIFEGKLTKWPDGPVIKLAVLTSGPVHEAVSRDYASKTPDQLDRFWKRLVFTGKGVMPFQAKSDEEVVDFVSKTPGAFGYIAAGSPTGTAKVVPLK